MDGAVELLRHTLATLAYRAGKAVRGAPAEFAEYRAAPDSRTPAGILAHMGDLFDWALGMCDGRHEWHNSPALSWDEGVARFFAALGAFDRRLGSGAPLATCAARITSRRRSRWGGWAWSRRKRWWSSIRTLSAAEVFA